MATTMCKAIVNNIQDNFNLIDFQFEFFSLQQNKIMNILHGNLRVIWASKQTIVP